MGNSGKDMRRYLRELGREQPNLSDLLLCVFSAAFNIIHKVESVEGGVEGFSKTTPSMRERQALLSGVLSEFCTLTAFQGILTSIPEGEARRMNAARKMRETIGELHSKFMCVDDDLAKSRQVQNLAKAMKAVCNEKSHSPEMVASLFFIEKFYKQLLNFFHSA